MFPSVAEAQFVERRNGTSLPLVRLQAARNREVSGALQGQVYVEQQLSVSRSGPEEGGGACRCPVGLSDPLRRPP
ncbi:hypothetical protein MTO96_044518 [Rhipicephalus appendiculatus]